MDIAQDGDNKGWKVYSFQGLKLWFTCFSMKAVKIISKHEKEAIWNTGNYYDKILKLKLNYLILNGTEPSKIYIVPCYGMYGMFFTMLAW